MTLRCAFRKVQLDSRWRTIDLWVAKFVRLKIPHASLTLTLRVGVLHGIDFSAQVLDGLPHIGLGWYRKTNTLQ